MSRKRRNVRGGQEVVAVGLTGGMGAGKSTALALFSGLGAVVVSADDLVHALYQQPAVIAEVGAHFGARVIGADGTIDRMRLAEAVRGRRDGLRFLERLTHPRVKQEIRHRVETAAAGSVVVCEVPLLFESGYERLFDLIITVEADDEVRRQRSAQSFDLEQFAELDALQASSEKRTKGSDLVYVNNGGVERLSEFVEAAYGTARKLLVRDRYRRSHDGR